MTTDLLKDIEDIWMSLNEFFASFSSADWERKHGKDWTFADVPYHLDYFNQLAADAIRLGASAQETDPITTIRELDRWNNARFAARPKQQTGADSFERMLASQDKLYQIATALPTLDARIWLTMLRVRGWRTASIALEYIFWHTWLHYSEAHLRHADTLPPLEPHLMQRALNFNMELIAGSVGAEKAAENPFVWVLELTNEGVWTFTVGGGQCGVVPERTDASADVVIEMDTATYLKTSAYRMQNRTLAMLSGRLKIHKGWRKIGQLQSLFAPAPDQVWIPLERGRR